MAAFRIFYRDFLRHAGDELNDAGIIKASEYTDACVNAWCNLANEFMELSTQIKEISSKEERNIQYNKIALLAEDLYDCEQELYSFLKALEK